MRQYYNVTEYITADGKHFYTGDYIDENGTHGHSYSTVPPAKTASLKPNQKPSPGPAGNAWGGIYNQTKPAPAGAAKDPQDSAQTKEENAWDQFKQKAKDGAQYYKDNVSQSLHDFAGSAMETGGTVATVGEGTMLAGGAVALTGVGAPVAAGMEVVGGATTVVGGGVAAVGGISEGAATLLDNAADMIITGRTPDLLGIALQLGETLLNRLISSRIPASNLGKKPPAKPNNDKKNDGKKKDEKGDGSGGGYVLGDGDSPCGIKPYKDQKCPKGQQAHHIVPDYSLRYGPRGDDAKRIPGMPSFDDGPSICLTGGSKVKGSDHNQAHEGTDPKFDAAGKRTDNGGKGLAPIGELIDIAVEEVAKVRPECADEIKRKVDDAFKNVDRSKYGRTTQQPPKEGSPAHTAQKNGDSHGSTPTRRRR